MGRYLQTPETSFNPGISDTKRYYGSGQYRIFNSSTTWTVPNGVSSVRVTAQGGGGGGGAAWSPMQNAGQFNVCYTYFYSNGGGGAGGGYTVGVASVTPGCICCIVVGSGGAGTNNICCYWCNNTCPSCCTPSWCCCCGFNTGSLCACNGSAGGFSCAFGICATGGGGGRGGRCGWGSLDPCVWCVSTTWATNCCCMNANVNCPCGYAVGGTGNGYVVRCGANGTPNCFHSSCQNICYNGYVNSEMYGGAAGSPLGDGCCASVPLLFNGCTAFDGSSDTESYLISKYDLPFPRWEGQIVYTQACGIGRPCGMLCCGCCCACSGNCNCFFCISMCRWQAAPSGTNFCFDYCCDPGGGYIQVCQTFSRACPGLGAGGTGQALRNTCTPSCVSWCNNYCVWPVNSAVLNGGNGQVIVEW